jgi:hypothetical protein
MAIYTSYSEYYSHSNGPPGKPDRVKEPLLGLKAKRVIFQNA